LTSSTHPACNIAAYGPGFYDVARAVVDKGTAFAVERDLRFVVAVVDHTFSVVALGRMDGTYPSCVGSATSKAQTSVNFGLPTDVVKERTPLDIRIGLAGSDGRLIFVGGGAPIIVNGLVVGGVGVSGGTEDEDIAGAACAIADIG
jgi:uncharacterized protein GlcG (DUF336 family)